MKWNWINLFFICILMLDLSADEISQASQMAIAFFEARDYEKANEIYERLLKQDLPDWQRAILFYNLGTLQLVQNHPEQALTLFQSVSFNDLSSPTLWRYLVTNEGLTYLKRAELLNAPSSVINDVEDRIYLLERSLESLEKAEKIDCELQKFEDEASQCVRLEDLQIDFQVVNLQLTQLRQQQREQILQTQPFSYTLILLIEALKKFKESLRKFNSSSYRDYLFHLGETLVPLWKSMEAQPLNSSSKQIIEEAEDHYVDALKFIQQQNLHQALDSLSQTLETLNQLQQQSPSDYLLQQLLLHYQMLQNKDHLEATDLQNLLAEHKKIQSDPINQKTFESSNQALVTSLKQLQNGHPDLAKFFLTESFYFIQNLSQKEGASSKEVLTMALEQAKRSIRLNRLAQIESLPDTLKKQVEMILKDAQTQTLQLAQPFIGSVLNEEKKHFHQTGPLSGPRCQRKPWEQAIPLFEKGYQEASIALTLLSRTSSLSRQSLLHQEQTIIQWQQVLQLLEQPPQSEEESKKQSEESQTSEAPETLNETFQTLQEMQAEDAPAPQGEAKEIKGW